jgi:hypothetical protein
MDMTISLSKFFKFGTRVAGVLNHATFMMADGGWPLAGSFIMIALISANTFPADYADKLRGFYLRKSA